MSYGLYLGGRAKKSGTWSPETEPEPEPDTNDPTEELLGALQRLYQDADYSDLVLSWGGQDYKVHKAIVCPRSDFFAAACRGDFGEAREGRISLSEDDPQVVDLMIYYMYHLDYDISQRRRGSEMLANGATAGWELPIHAKVYAIAEKYGVVGLKTVSHRKFEAALAKTDRNQDNLIKAAREAYESTVETDRRLRDAVAAHFYTYSLILDKKEVQDLLKEVPMLAYDLLMLMHRRRVNPFG
ncbi:hypothetical protein MAPG_03764 [Magnaporthiopsis poae ATCC 64411]|uniref:BTB domain-containing protein n=1 Tax=Magnaporthiopsis poae (strain ATCC 64411 / 73-15) TaxID=644358 RepID=A0A0C4DUW9_MAGP6|nr:hypothetical protein MAPG_03764 [Magnaporthiopsis poae ATCC 64411]